MSNDNRLREVFLMVLIAVILLGALSFINTTYTILGYESKKIDLLKDIRYSTSKKQPPFPGILFTDGIRDSINKIKQQQQRIAIQSFTKSDTINAMDRFFSSLYQTKQTGRKTRIAYFGDSMIEGDLLTQDLRASLQKAFGGSGVGFVPITSIVAGFRQTILHSFSSDWQVYNFTQPGSDKVHAIAPSGYTFVPNPGSWVSYSSPKAYRSFNQVKLYYGKSDGSTKIEVMLPDGTQQFNLTGKDDVNELTLNPADYINNIRINFKTTSNLNVYGCSFETPSGVFVDNYAFRGNSGLPLTSVPTELYQGFNTYFNYDLIVLHYGLNVIKHNIGDYSWYEHGLENIINNMKQNFPNSSLLLVSLGDKSYQNTENEYHTEPDVPIIVEMQQRVAKKTGIAFWNLYENMGGYDAMKRWVEGDTIYANRDYSHPNNKGAKKISDMLFNKLMEGYNRYASKQTK
jgi:hypothetical protein